MQYVTCITRAAEIRCGNPECTTRDKIPPHGPEPSSLQRSWQEKLHRGRSKPAQVENAERPAVVATQLDCPFGKPFFNLRPS